MIEQTLKSGYEDWSQWLKCDTAIAIPCSSVSPLKPLTRSTAHSAGWQWRIPLQHRIGNGHVFSSKYMSNDEATAILLNNLDGEPLADPRIFKFTPGIRKQPWIKNCVAVGLASGFIEPLESTSIHFVVSAISRIGTFFPRNSFDQTDIDEYNRLTRTEYEHVRDFIILHYHATERNDSDFWKYVSTMELPKSLSNKLSLYKTNGRAFRNGFVGETFTESSWLTVMTGQRIVPKSYHPLADLIPREKTLAFLDNVEDVIKGFVNQMPTHEAFIKSIL